MKNLGIIIAAAAVASSVAFAGPAQNASPVSEKDQPRYQSAYQAGCDYATFGRTRNDLAFASEKAYHDGWIAGYGACMNRAMMQNTGKPAGYLDNLF